MRSARSRFLRATLAILTFAVVNLTARGQAFSAAATFVTFDVPDAGTGSNQGTSPASINFEGNILPDRASTEARGLTASSW